MAPWQPPVSSDLQRTLASGDGNAVEKWSDCEVIVVIDDSYHCHCLSLRESRINHCELWQSLSLIINTNDDDDDDDDDDDNDGNDDDDDDDDDDHEPSPYYNHAVYLDREKLSLRPRCIQQYQQHLYIFGFWEFLEVARGSSSLTCRFGVRSFMETFNHQISQQSNLPYYIMAIYRYMHGWQKAPLKMLPIPSFASTSTG